MKRRVIIDLELSLQLRGISRSKLPAVLAALDWLADAPVITGDSTSRDGTGRIIHHKTIGHWHYAYWEDAPVNELRILDIRRDS